MPYSTLDDLKKALPVQTLLQLCDDDNVGVIVTSPPNTAYNNIVHAIEQADNLIDSYVGDRYDIPEEDVPGVIRDASVNLAICFLFDRKREMDVPDGVERRRKAAITWLKDVQSKKASIPELKESRNPMYSVSKTEDDRMFTDTILDQY